MEQKPQATPFLGMYDSNVEKQEVAELQGRSENQKSKTKNQKSEKQKAAEEGVIVGKLKPQSTENFNEPLAEDFYPDLKKGEHTYLNVLRFPDVQYFVRLKRVFKLTFDPLTGLKEAYINNQITRGKVETILGVSVDGEGNLAEAFVFRSSGVERYDQEVLRTIRASAPFSTPPSKLLDSEGLVRMTWTFTVFL